MPNSSHLNRRMFLKRLALLGTSASLLATQDRFQLISSAAAATSDYSNLSDHKSLVCIFLNGGNDGFNTLIPYEPDQYQNYQTSRASLAIPRSELTPLKGGQQAFHPSLSDLSNLYDTDKLAVVANVGSLIQPISKFEFQQGSAPLPSALFSHSHQQSFWQTARQPEGGILPTGWGGRMADLLHSSNVQANTPLSYSLSGSNFWLGADTTSSFSMNSAGIKEFNHFQDINWPAWNKSRFQAFSGIQSLDYSDSLLKRQMNNVYDQARGRIDILGEAYRNAPEITTVYPKKNNLASSLKAIAQMISIREELGLKRQFFFVSLGGWDTHNDQLDKHSAQLSTLNDAMKAFYETTVELGVSNSVTTFTASEFGRTYGPNREGTDHAWSSHNFVMGGAVDGGKIHGQLPSFELGGIDDSSSSGTGRFIPQYSVDQYAGTLGKWMGISDSDNREILTNLNNFSTVDLGFMKA